VRDPQPITDPRQLVEHFRAGAKPRDAWRVGAEHEKIGVYSDGRPIPYEGSGGIRALLEELARRTGGRPVDESGSIIAIDLGRSSITLEPGGQLELSGTAAADATEAAPELLQHLALLKGISAPLDISWLAVGFRPFGRLDDVPWMPKGRYRVMKAYLPTRGRLAHEMMKRTATVQANLDYSDELDAARKLRTAMGVSSLVTALFANSPLVDGKPSGYLSYRAAVWLETDPDRCGILPLAFDDPETLFARYADWALDVPMFFVYRGAYTPAEGMTFRQFLAQGFRGERATLGDWELHLSTLFPEVRLKRYLEVRGADAGPADLVQALPALWRGLLYDSEACAAAWALVASLHRDERETLRREVPRQGLAVRVRDHTIGDLAGELIAIARAGLERLGGGDASLLAPLERVAAERRVPAEHVLETHARCGGDPARMIPALRY
jgi:glutamate--cysteine ligase